MKKQVHQRKESKTMLYVYKGKIYVRPFDNKLVEVKVLKKGQTYDVKATDKTLEINDEIKSKLASISLEEAYKMQNEKNDKFDLD